MRILFERPISGDRFDGLVSRKDGILEILQAKVEDAISTLILGPGRVFMPEDFSLNSDSGVELSGYFQRGMELYIQLQTQFVQLRWVDPLDRPLHKRLFDVKSMKEHFIQRKKVSSNMPVELIVCPAISFLGNEDGEGYDKEKLLLKSTVWVNNKGDKIDGRALQSMDGEDPKHLDGTGYSRQSDMFENLDDEKDGWVEQMDLDQNDDIGA
jgi:hypothetical protein